MERRLKGKPSEKRISRTWEWSIRSNNAESLSDGIFYWIRLGVLGGAQGRVKAEARVV